MKISGWRIISFYRFRLDHAPRLRVSFLVVLLFFGLPAIPAPPAHGDPLPPEVRKAVENLIVFAQYADCNGTCIELHIAGVRSKIAEQQKDVDSFLMTRPNVLFNFALAMDMASDRHLAAAAYYQAYLLAAPEAGNAAAVKQRIGDLERLYKQSVLKRVGVVEKLVAEGLVSGCALVKGPYDLECLEYALAYIDGGKAFAGNREEAQRHLIELIRSNVGSLEGTDFNGKDGKAFRIGEIIRNLVYGGHAESTRAMQEEIPPVTWHKFAKYVESAEEQSTKALKPFQCDRPVKHWHEVFEKSRSTLAEETDGLKNTLLTLSGGGQQADKVQQGIFIVNYAEGTRHSARNWLHYEQTRLSCRR